MEGHWGCDAHSSMQIAPQPAAHNPGAAKRGGSPGSPDNAPNKANFSLQELQAQGVAAEEASIVMDSSFPFRIRFASDKWLQLFRFDRPAVTALSPLLSAPSFYHCSPPSLSPACDAPRCALGRFGYHGRGNGDMRKYGARGRSLGWELSRVRSWWSCTESND